jgi:uncharacterized membrane protein
VMDPNTPMTMAAAKYATRPEAVEAFKTIWGARHQGDFDHMALAVITKNENGELEVERHDSTTKHLGWAGAAIGGALIVVCPPAGIAAVATGAGAGAGIGAWVGHFHHQIPKDDIRELGDVLDEGESAIFVVTVNPRQTDITPLLMNPEKSKVVQTNAGDWDAVAAQALQKADQEKAAAGAPAGS